MNSECYLIKETENVTSSNLCFANSILAANCSNNTPLHLAIKKQDEQLVSILLNNSFTNISERNYKGETPLIVAVKTGHLGIIDQILEKDCNINAKDSNGSTALMYAVKMGNSEAVKLILKTNSCLIDTPNKYGQTVLHEIAKTERLDILSQLVDKNANVNALDRYDNMPLMYATLHKRLDCVTYLLEKGCATNVANKGGRTALHTAAWNHFVEIAKQLLKHGASPDILDFENCSPALVAAKAHCKEILQMMLEANCCVLNVNLSGRTIFHYLCPLGYDAMVRQLLLPKYNVNTELKDQYGNGPLFLAVLANQVQIVKRLLEHNCNPNQTGCCSAYSKLPTDCLAKALSKGYVEICLLLIEAGARVNNFPKLLTQRYVHSSIVQNVYFMNLIQKLISNPRSLQILCRDVIRLTIGPDIHTKLDKINFPHTIKNIIMITTFES